MNLSEDSNSDNQKDDPVSKFNDGWHEYFRKGKIIRANPKLSIESISSVYLEMFFRKQKLASGSGFFWRTKSAICLVTAWHNLSGLHHTVRYPIATHGGLPDRIRIKYTSQKPQEFHQLEIPLYIDDEMINPRWMVHHKVGSFFDIAFLMLKMNDHDVFCVNDRGVFDGRLEPGSEVFSVGYPQGISTAGGLPIWKRGTIASEIDFPTDGHPKFLIDISGRAGLSGSPVYRLQRGIITDNPGEISLGSTTRFLGLYSGRASDQMPAEQRENQSTDLGFVWRREIVEDVLKNSTPDEKPEIGKGRLMVSTMWSDIGE